MKEIRKTITRATTIRVLYSEDIDITILDEIVKNRVYRLSSTNELKIFKKNYLVEILEISLSVRVVEKKESG